MAAALPAEASPPARAGPWADLVVLAFLASLLGGLLAVGREWATPFTPVSVVDLSLGSLPAYAGLSLARGLAAYVVSLAFTLVFGTIAGRSPRWERVLIPVLDILQSIPVLSFLPAFVRGLIALFPTSNIGLELACVFAIFTGQVWNMTFSYHASMKRIPSEMDEVARLHGFGGWKRFRVVELPAATVGLVWNSMMSMAGGWFFLTVVESFQIGPNQYRLPGLGSFMAEAVGARDGRAMLAAVGAMVAIIVAMDRLMWRPLLCWAERFRLDDSSTREPPRSLVYEALRRSRFAAWMGKRLGGGEERAAAPAAVAAAGAPRAGLPAIGKAALALLSAAALGGAAWGAWRVARLLVDVGPAEWAGIAGGIARTALRVLACLAVSALWAIPAGIALGRSERLSRWFLPLVQLLASFPAPMLFPLIAGWMLGAGFSANVTAVALMLMGAQWYVLFNAAAGASGVPNDLREAAQAFDIPGMRRFAVLWVAGAIPALLTGLVTAAGGAWNASIVCERVDLPGGGLHVGGVGSQISAAFEQGNDAVLAAATVAMAATLVFINRFGWKPLQRMAAARFAINR